MTTYDYLDALPMARALAAKTGHAYRIETEDGVLLARVLPPRDGANIMQAAGNPLARWDVGGWKAAR